MSGLADMSRPRLGAAALVTAMLAVVIIGCGKPDKVAEMIKRMEAAPPEERPPDWERTKALISRQAPKVGEVAPDFTLKTASGEEEVTLSKFRPGQPKVLVFGSFT